MLNLLKNLDLNDTIDNLSPEMQNKLLSMLPKDGKSTYDSTILDMTDEQRQEFVESIPTMKSPLIRKFQSERLNEKIMATKSTDRVYLVTSKSAKADDKYVEGIIVSPEGENWIALGAWLVRDRGIIDGSEIASPGSKYIGVFEFSLKALLTHVMKSKGVTPIFQHDPTMADAMADLVTQIRKQLHKSVVRMPFSLVGPYIQFVDEAVISKAQSMISNVSFSDVTGANLPDDTLWHYTKGVHLPSILDDRIIWPIHGVVPNELPAVWLSTNQEWEHITTPMFLDGGRMTIEEMSDSIGVVRIQIDPSLTPLHWDEFISHCGISRGHEKILKNSSNGSDVTKWYCTLNPLTDNFWISIQILVNGEWKSFSYDETGLKELEPFLAKYRKLKKERHGPLYPTTLCKPSLPFTN